MPKQIAARTEPVGVETADRRRGNRRGPAPISVRAGWSFSVALWGLHLVAAFLSRDLHAGLMHAVTALYDTILLLGLGWVLHGLLRPGLRLAGPVSVLVIAAAAMVLSTYPLLLVDSLRFPVNVFLVDSSMASFFVASLIGGGGVVAMLGVALCGLAILRTGWPRRRMNGLLLFITLLGAGGIAASVSGVAPALSPHPHVLIYSLIETARPPGERVVAPISAPATDTDPAARPPSPVSAAGTFAFDHVFLIVMETVETPGFLDEFAQTENGYFNRVRDNSVFYDNYYSPNLDSYTALIAMLTGQQVPYRAYDVPSRYASVNDAPNLVSALNAAGFESLFICTAEMMPDVAGGQSWDRVMLGRDFTDRNGYVVVTGNAVEAGIEDRIALPEILGFVRRHARTLVMQELIFGHSTRWQAETGMAQLAYYDTYLGELLGGLEDAGLVEHSLIVLVADHGERTDASNPGRYHVPLLVTGRGLDGSVNSDFLTHLDLQAIIAHYLSNAPHPPARDEVLLVGHSARWTYGRLTADGLAQFIDARRGTLLAREAEIDPEETRQQFQALVDSFSRFMSTD